MTTTAEMRAERADLSRYRVATADPAPDLLDCRNEGRVADHRVVTSSFASLRGACNEMCLQLGAMIFRLDGGLERFDCWAEVWEPMRVISIIGSGG
jgi:hypothetical protein